MRPVLHEEALAQGAALPYHTQTLHGPVEPHLQVNLSGGHDAVPLARGGLVEEPFAGGIDARLHEAREKCPVFFLEPFQAGDESRLPFLFNIHAGAPIGVKSDESGAAGETQIAEREMRYAK